MKDVKLLACRSSTGFTHMLQWQAASLPGPWNMAQPTLHAICCFIWYQLPVTAGLGPVSICADQCAYDTNNSRI